MNYTLNSFYKLFSNCIPVKGFTRSLIMDLQREKYFFIPNDLFEILSKKGSTVGQIIKQYGSHNEEIILGYFNYLIERDLVHFAEEEAFFEKFPAINLHYDDYSLVETCIIDITRESKHDYEKIFTELNNLQCKYILLRFKYTASIEDINKVLLYGSTGQIKSFEILVPHGEDITEESLTKLGQSFLRLNKIIVYLSPPYLQGSSNGNSNLAEVVFTDIDLSNNTHCGFIIPEEFSVNINTYTEMLSFNGCLNKKISIDENGDIKSCPIMENSYGNINQNSLYEVMQSTEITKLWNITKESIKECNICEFRNICTDCRGILVDEKDILSKPKNCKYNPFSGEWVK